MERRDRINEIIDPITECLEQIDADRMPPADEIADLALRGLKESVHLGYMRDHNARAIFARYFPDYQYGE